MQKYLRKHTNTGIHFNLNEKISKNKENNVFPNVLWRNANMSTMTESIELKRIIVKNFQSTQNKTIQSIQINTN